MAARRSSKASKPAKPAKPAAKSRGKAAEVAAVEEEGPKGSSLTLEDGMQIFTTVALIGAILIMFMTLLPRYAEQA